MMSNDFIPLSESELASIVSILSDIQTRLRTSGHAMAALQTGFALECLTPGFPLGIIDSHTPDSRASMN